MPAVESDPGNIQQDFLITRSGLTGLNYKDSFCTELSARELRDIRVAINLYALVNSSRIIYIKAAVSAPSEPSNCLSRQIVQKNP
jgi:hypothetical protein